jgi:hypothetical protein
VLSFRPMSDATFSNPTPQFGTAEYTGQPGNDHCQFCHLPIVGPYYRVNSAMTCPSCAEKTQGELSADTHAAYMRALLFGAGAAVLGMILYATFAITTGIVIGYAALAVGWLIGKAMIAGSNGVGGRRYQIAAVLLTYAAVSTAAIPIWIHYAGGHKTQSHKQQAETTQQPDDLDAAPQSSTRQTQPSRAYAIGMLIGLGLASPFLDLASNPLGGLIGLVILFVGMKFAWRFTAAKPIQVNGPFENTLPVAR